MGTVVCTNRGTIRADAVVFAAGAWTGELLDGFSDKVTPVREHVHLGVHEGVKTPQVIRAQNGYIQWRSSASGWAISERAGLRHLEMGEQDTSQTPEPISTALNQFRAHLTEHCPDPQAVQRPSGRKHAMDCRLLVLCPDAHGYAARDSWEMTGVLGFEQEKR